MDTVYLSHPHQLSKENLQPTVMALGFFDGVHLGHQRVIKKATQIADECKMISAVMTFDPHPREVLSKSPLARMNYLTPIQAKERLISKLGVDTLYIVRFDLAFASLFPQQFVDEYLIGLNVKHVVAGFDYTYGKLGKGTMETLPFHSRKHFEQTTIQKVDYDLEKISSSLVRHQLDNGAVSILPDYLGRYYEITGTVVSGDKRGREIGFPTANIQPADRYYLPGIGVYAVTLQIRDKWYNGVCNVGFKPTFHDHLKEPTIEVHLFNFNQVIYNEKVVVQWRKRIRAEKKFSSIQDLINQLNLDKQEAEEYFQLNGE